MRCIQFVSVVSVTVSVAEIPFVRVHFGVSVCLRVDVRVCLFVGGKRG